MRIEKTINFGNLVVLAQLDEKRLCKTLLFYLKNEKR